MAMIYIRDLVVEGKHGVHAREKEIPQRFSVTAELVVDITKAGSSDNIEDTVNWSQARDTIIATVQNNTFNLVERLAAEIAKQLLSDKKIQKAIVSVDKLEAFESGIPGVRIEMSN